MPGQWDQYVESQPTGKWDQFVEKTPPQQLPQNPIPQAYGFTPGHMLNQAVQGVTQLGQGIYSLGKDLVQNPNWLEGANSTYAKFVGKPADEMRAKQAQALAQGQHLQAGGYGLASALPFIGPWAAGLGEQAGTGDIGGAAAKGSAQVAVSAAASSPVVRGAAKGAIRGGAEGLLQTKITGGIIRGAIKGAQAARVAGAPVPEVAAKPTEPPTPTPQPPVNRIPQPSGAEPDIEMQMRLGTTEPPAQIRPKGAPDRLGSPEEIKRIRDAMESRLSSKKELETKGLPGAAMEKQLTGANPYSVSSAPKNMIDVSGESSNISKMGHNGKSMWVEYKNGKIYEYKNVSADQFKTARNAESIGSHIARNFKGKPQFPTTYKGTAPSGTAKAAD